VLTLLRFSFDIAPDGKLENCVVLEQVNQGDSSTICSAILHQYDVSNLPIAARKGTGWMAVSTGPFTGPLPPLPPLPVPPVAVPSGQ
jgi:hypothetical protein